MAIVSFILAGIILVLAISNLADIALTEPGTESRKYEIMECVGFLELSILMTGVGFIHLAF